MVLRICLAIAIFGSGYGLAQIDRPIPKPPPETVEPPIARAPCEAQASLGPFRPRPVPPPAPLPEPQNDTERTLFPRIKEMLDARDARIEARQDAKLSDAFDAAAEQLANADPEKVQGFFGGAFVSSAIAFIKKTVVWAMKALLIGILGGLVVTYWYIVAPVAAFLFIALPAWSARTFVTQEPPKIVVVPKEP